MAIPVRFAFVINRANIDANTRQGQIIAPSVSVAGTGAVARVGTGAITAPSVSASGVATAAGYVLSGAITAQPPLLSGVGVRQVNATSNITAPSVGVSATGERAVTGAGAITSPAATVVGTIAGLVTGTGAITAPSVGVSATDGESSGNWSERSTGAVKAFQFNTAADVTDNIWNNGDSSLVSYELGTGRSGNGCIRIDHPDAYERGGVGENGAAFAIYLQPSQAAYGNGDEFWVQYAVKPSQGIYQYKSEYSAGNGGWKTSILSALPNSFTDNEIVINNNRALGFVQGYYRGVPPGGSGTDFVQWSGHDGGRSTPCNASNFAFQPAIDAGAPSSPANCNEYAQRYGPIYDYTGSNPESNPISNPGLGTDVSQQGDGHPNPNALLSGAIPWNYNRWVTIQTHVSIGTLGVANSTVEIDVALDGDTSWTRLFEATDVNLGTDNGGYTGLWLTMFETNRNSNSRGVNESPSLAVNGHMNWDELIISETEIPLPEPSWPTWRQNAVEGRWSTIDTQLDDQAPSGVPGNTGFGAIVSTWNTAVATPDSYIIACSGGDQDWGGNGVYELSFRNDTPLWDRVTEPATNLNLNGSYHADGTPNCAHNYDHQIWIPSYKANGNRVFQAARYSLYNGTNSSMEAYSWDRATQTYDAQDTFDDKTQTFINFTACAAWDDQEGLMWWVNHQGGWFQSFDPDASSGSQWVDYANSYSAGQSGTNTDGASSAEIHPIKRIFLKVTEPYGFQAFDLDSPTTLPVTITGVGSGIDGDLREAPGIVYHPPSDAFLMWADSGSTIYVLRPGANWRNGTDWDWYAVTAAGGGATPPDQPTSGSGAPRGVFGRLQWIEAFDMLAIVNGTSQDFYYYPLPRGGV